MLIEVYASSINHMDMKNAADTLDLWWQIRARSMRSTSAWRNGAASRGDQDKTKGLKWYERPVIYFREMEGWVRLSIKSSNHQ